MELDLKHGAGLVWLSKIEIDTMEESVEKAKRLQHNLHAMAQFGQFAIQMVEALIVEIRLLWVEQEGLAQRNSDLQNEIWEQGEIQEMEGDD